VAIIAACRSQAVCLQLIIQGLVFRQKNKFPSKFAGIYHCKPMVHFFCVPNDKVVAKARSNSVFSSFNSLQLMPVYTIVVPENLERLPYQRLIRDVSDIFFKIATTAGGGDCGYVEMHGISFY
jgi:hypothetical protein